MYAATKLQQVLNTLLCICTDDHGQCAKILFVLLKRNVCVYNTHGRLTGMRKLHYGCIPNTTLIIGGKEYRRTGCACHLGKQLSSEHYVTAAHNESGFTLYNDAARPTFCEQLTPELVQGACLFAYVSSNYARAPGVSAKNSDSGDSSSDDEAAAPYVESNLSFTMEQDLDRKFHSFVENALNVFR